MMSTMWTVSPFAMTYSPSTTLLNTTVYYRDWSFCWPWATAHFEMPMLPQPWDYDDSVAPLTAATAGIVRSSPQWLRRKRVLGVVGAWPSLTFLLFDSVYFESYRLMSSRGDGAGGAGDAAAFQFRK